MKLNLYLSLCTKLNSKWIKDIEIRPETLHLIEDKVDPNLHHVGLGSDFLNKTPKRMKSKQETINGMDSNKNFSQQRIQSMIEKSPQSGRKYSFLEKEYWGGY